jgi:hypothetical protein
MIIKSLSCGDPHRVFGLDIDLHPKAYFLRFTVSEARSGESQVEHYNVRDQLIAVPALVAIGPDIDSFRSLVEPMTAANPDEVDLPLTRVVNPNLSYRIVEHSNDYNLVLRGRLRMPLLVSDRFLYFAAMTKTIALLCSNSANDKMFISSLSADNSENRVPIVSGLMASSDSRHIDSILEKSTRWDAYAIGNPSLFADSREFNDDQYEVYEIRKSVKRVPSFTVDAKCFICDTRANITIEHCTPNWLMTRLGLHPITAPIVCDSCNGRLGIELERPLQDAYDHDTVLDDTELTSLWALKTAVALALASNISVPKDLRLAAAKGELKGSRVEVFAVRTPLDEESHFQYVVTRLRRSLVNTSFMLSFGFPGYYFLVVRWEDVELIQIPILHRIYPDIRAASEMSQERELIPALLEMLSGDQFRFEPLQGTEIKSLRT